MKAGNQNFLPKQFWSKNVTWGLLFQGLTKLPINFSRGIVTQVLAEYILHMLSMDGYIPERNSGILEQ